MPGPVRFLACSEKSLMYRPMRAAPGYQVFEHEGLHLLFDALERGNGRCDRVEHRHQRHQREQAHIGERRGILRAAIRGKTGDQVARAAPQLRENQEAPSCMGILWHERLPLVSVRRRACRAFANPARADFGWSGSAPALLYCRAGFYPTAVCPTGSAAVSDFTISHNPRAAKSRISSRAVIGLPPKNVLELIDS